MRQSIVITADGKLVTDAAILERFNMPGDNISFHPLVASETVDELLVIILPIILGGHEALTMTGAPGAFFKIPAEFSLASKKVKKGVCYLCYLCKKIYSASCNSDGS